MTINPNEPAGFCVLLLGGTSEIGLAILAALHLAPDAEVILAGRDPQRLEAAGKSLNRPVTVARYDAVDTDGHQAFADEICAAGSPRPGDRRDRHPDPAGATPSRTCGSPPP